MSGSGVDGATRSALRSRVRREARRRPQPEVEALLDALRLRFGDAFVGAVYYGSCRRRTEVEGLVDLHVIVTDPRAALGRFEGVLCALLPPNVYYLETEHAGATVRCKFAVLGLAQFRRVCTRQAFHSYFWARYAQPVSVVGADEDAREALEESLVDALATYFSRVLPAFPGVDDGLELWVSSLALCYTCELRPEGQDRSRALVEADADYYRATADAALAARRSVLAANGPGGARARWSLRAGWGKAVSLARLLKALATFDGGLDYAAWKLERHSGRHVEVPEAVRRRPLVHVWPLLWRLWREGVFR